MECLTKQCKYCKYLEKSPYNNDYTFCSLNGIERKKPTESCAAFAPNITKVKHQ